MRTGKRITTGREVDRRGREEGRAKARAQGQEAEERRGTRGGAAAAADRRRQEDRVAQLLRPWWLREPARLARERRALAEAGFAVRRRIDDLGRLLLHLQRGRERFTLVYQHAFPDAITVAHAGHHRPAKYGDKIGVAYVGDDPAGLVALTSARFGCRSEESFRVTRFSILLTPAWQRIEGEGGRLEFGWSERLTAALPRRITGTPAGHLVALFALGLQDAFPVKGIGWWVRGSALDWRGGPDAAAARIEEAIADHHAIPLAELRMALRHGVAAYGQPSARRRDATDWVFLRRKANGEPVFGESVLASPQDFQVRAPFAKTLEEKRVAIVGCGSLGWPIAMGLARAGVRKFALYDLDQLWIGNLARLGARIGDVGRFKVEALAGELRQISSWMHVEPHPLYAGEHVGARALIAAKPDLIVDASAEDRSPPETNAAALALGVPGLYAWMTYTVRAARLFRVVPGRTACYACVANSKPRSIVGSDGSLSPNGIWDGANFNIDAVAAAAVRMAVRTLAGDEVDSSNPDHVVLRFGGPVPTATRLEITRDAGCVVCGDGSSARGSDDDADGASV